MDKWKHGPQRRAIQSGIAALVVAVMVLASLAGSASAQSLLEKIKNGETIRVGFSNEVPWAYPGENNQPLGFVNAMTTDMLKKLGTTKVEPVVTEWGSLIPGLQAGRFDIITGGMYILPERCRNVLFTDPIVKATDALIVPAGNPENLHSYQDVHDKSLTFATGAGYSEIALMRKLGVPDDKIMQVAGPAEILQAVKSGRAAAGSGAYFTMKEFTDKDDSVALVPVGNNYYSGLAFLPNQQAEVDAFNAVLKDYIGSDEMMVSVGKYGYTKANLPDGKTTAELCEH
ncbi:ectoine/hydroxyectoine ABC transporter substrate-binding protein EhuB [Mesorhizobium erdmanii]|uniref:ectoine/hydroxyectoine ABC transporter substrate-binding protein EhuB n=1 Tax=Mesorhizobium erdmanii TaxID=1777866 RepID=UPI00047E42A4|nr:ectoine/hydroxyectoine ABC transporter substrate-binding protein EhuB [Mesorhizobium erdmanii]